MGADAEPQVRRAEPDDAERVLEVAQSSMTTSYALSPGEIETIAESAFGVDEIRERIDDDDAVVLIAEADGVIAGVAVASVDDGTGEVEWVHVDPERRGGGVGSALFEAVIDALDERGVDETVAVALESNTEAEAFFEGVGLERTGEREADLADIDLVEYVYAADASAADGAESTDDTPTETPPDEYPETATTDEGEELYLSEETAAGTKGLFVTTYSDADRSERYGFYCAYCGSLDVSVDDMERYRCGNCGNRHAPDEEYDASYL